MTKDIAMALDSRYVTIGCSKKQNWIKTSIFKQSNKLLKTALSELHKCILDTVAYLLINIMLPNYNL